MCKTHSVITLALGSTLLLLFIGHHAKPGTCAITAADADLSSPLTSIEYVGQGQQALTMSMGSNQEITLRLSFNKDLVPSSGADAIALTFRTQTLSPQFNILSLDTASTRLTIPKRQLESSKYVHETRLRLHANYIGHAILQPVNLEFLDPTGKRPSGQLSLASREPLRLRVTIIQHEGTWGTVFIVCVSIFMLISYVNLGAQLDLNNMRQLIKRPMTLILGFLISVFVMPVLAWFVGEWFLREQPLFRIGSFIFACSPAASASTLWTVMLNSDKELSVGLQVMSTVGALFTMPLLLYLMDKSLSLNHEVSHTIKVPYGRLVQALFALLVALAIGWRFIGKNERAQKISRKIFRPLIFFVLIFIIVFSSILYWHIYQMFDLQITLASLLITMLTYMISGALGHLINCDMERAVPIAIGSAYKNSGIAFAVLLVAFDAPDTYIAYVPCLTQIVITSLTLYLTYLAASLYTCVRRRGQPDVIEASVDDLEAAGAAKKKVRRGSSTGRDIKPAGAAQASPNGAAQDAADEVGDVDELIAMNVTDIDHAESLPSGGGAGEDNQQKQHESFQEAGEQVSIKVVVSGGDNDDENDDDDNARASHGTRV